MKIQFNTDKTVDGKERYEDYFTAKVAHELKRFKNEISRVEAHISDENGKKGGIDKIRCLLEVRIEGRQPISVVDSGDTFELAISGSIAKLKALVETIIGKIKKTH